MPDGALLTTPEAAERLGVARSTITRWVQTGKLTPSHKGPAATSAYLFNEDEIAKFEGD